MFLCALILFVDDWLPMLILAFFLNRLCRVYGRSGSYIEELPHGRYSVGLRVAELERRSTAGHNLLYGRCYVGL